MVTYHVNFTNITISNSIHKVVLKNLPLLLFLYVDDLFATGSRNHPDTNVLVVDRDFHRYQTLRDRRRRDQETRNRTLYTTPVVTYPFFVPSRDNELSFTEVRFLCSLADDLCKSLWFR